MLDQRIELIGILQVAVTIEHQREEIESFDDLHDVPFRRGRTPLGGRRVGERSELGEQRGREPQTRKRDHELLSNHWITPLSGVTSP